MSIQTLSYAPGQTATIFLQTLDANGQRADGYDGYSLPFIDRLVFPDLTLATGYPANMVQLDVGLYYYQFILPTGASAIGSYLVDVWYPNPATSLQNYALYQIVVTAPGGFYGATSIISYPACGS